MPLDQKKNQAQLYNEKRRILFCAANDRKLGFNIAYEWLDGYKKKLGYNSYIGLKAELRFYEYYRKEYALTVAGDTGEHADFAGMIDKKPIRFDVTTNLDYKKFKNYEPFLGDGIKYNLAFFDQKNFELIDVLSLAFESCRCGGFLIPSLLLLPENSNRHGEPNGTYDQVLFEVCTRCGEHRILERYTHSFLYSIREYSRQLSEYYEESSISDEEYNQYINDYSLDVYNFFRREHKEDLMCIGSRRYVDQMYLTGIKGDGEYKVSYDFMNKVVVDDLSEELDIDID
jgi:hypothetical protein